ncbi:hypothetical protein [Serratia sp. JUb9]|uniref:hypothetical protein n=1 Tax=Serratia sp. JUb9 TaxID=2724469 RepID=UPI002108441D|nr:hypothetical protein [Serratia sp. JUb9]
MHISMPAEQKHHRTLMILRPKDMVRFRRIVQENITYIMTKNEALKKKIALQETKVFLRKINGISNVEVIDVDVLDLVAYRAKQKEIFSYDSDLEPIADFSLDNSNNAIVQWQSDCLKCIAGKSLFFEVNDFYFVRLIVSDVCGFLKSLYLENGNRDLVLFIESSSQMFAFNEGEYVIYFYDELI